MPSSSAWRHAQHLLPVTGQVFDVKDWYIDIVAEKVSQYLLALKLRKLPKVAVSPEEVEDVVDQILPSSDELVLEFGEVGPAFMNDHGFPFNDGLAGDVEGAGNQRKALGSVQTVAGEYALLALVDVHLARLIHQRVAERLASVV